MFSVIEKRQHVNKAKQKRILKIQRRTEEADINICSYNYISLVQMAMLAGVQAQAIAMINIISSNVPRGTFQ